jgi:hypothetical protein
MQLTGMRGANTRSHGLTLFEGCVIGILLFVSLERVKGMIWGNVGDRVRNFLLDFQGDYYMDYRLQTFGVVNTAISFFEYGFPPVEP